MKNSKQFILALSLIAFIAAGSLPCAAEVTKLLPDYRRTLEEIAEFRPISNTSDLPRAILALCVDQHGKMANPGEAWEATDDIGDENLPRKRLIWAAELNNLYVVHYERGGFVHSFHIMVATVEPDGLAKIIWMGTAADPFKNYGAFAAALKANKIDDRYNYGP